MSRTPAPIPVRIIARLDIKGANVIKGVHLEGLRVIGPPGEIARRYYRAGADEIIYMDVVASLYGRNNILSVVEEAAQEIFVPMTVGGGIRTIEDIVAALRSGADKVAVNTAAIARPEFLSEAARIFGSQCIVLSVEAKLRAPGQWEALTDNGRETSGIDVLDWVVEAERLGVGEILLTSVDREGTRRGFDKDLISVVRQRVQEPVIACGGAGRPDDVIDLITESDCDAVCCASIFHYDVAPIRDVKESLVAAGHGGAAMIVIVDCGRGNLFSLSKALDQIGTSHCISDEAALMGEADGLILPGVGAFGDSMAALQARDLIAPLRDAVTSGTPLLEICLGMQILATAGDEFGRHEGLGFIPGLVQRLPSPRARDPEAVRIPNVGWRRLESCRADALTHNLSDGEMMYFIHSFGMVVEDADNVVATVRVNGLDVPAIVRHGAICGCQFHPERSGEAGLALLAQFVKLETASLLLPQTKSGAGN